MKHTIPAAEIFPLSVMWGLFSNQRQRLRGKGQQRQDDGLRLSAIVSPRRHPVSKKFWRSGITKELKSKTRTWKRNEASTVLIHPGLNLTSQGYLSARLVS